MYIKSVTKKNKRSPKTYRYLHLVENIRTPGGPRQRLILNLGKLDIPEDQFKELANCIEGMLAGQLELFSADPTVEKIARKAVRQILDKRSRQKTVAAAASLPPGAADFQLVNVNSLQAHEPRSIGAEYVCHQLWKELDIRRVLRDQGVSDITVSVIETLVISRLVSPASELSGFNWALDRSAVYELLGIRGPSLSSFYRAGDKLFNCKQVLESYLSRQEKALFHLPETMCFLDLTNTYLEGLALSNPKAKHGRSKEKRSDCKLLTLGLILDEQGFAKYSQVYAGNQSEEKTLSNMIEALIAARPDLETQRTVIMDAGIATEDNVQYLKDHGYHYIVVNRSKAGFSPQDIEEMRVLREEERRQFKLEVLRRQVDNEVLLLCRSSGRTQKDQGIRSRQEALFIEQLQYLKDGLSKKGHTKTLTKISERIGRMKEKYPRAARHYQLTVIADEKKPAKACDIRWEKNPELSRLDGCYVLRTDLLEMSDEQIWKTYMMLTRVENAFRCLKSELGLRPVFHQVAHRCDAHLFISVVAYHILHMIEYRLRQYGDHRSWDTIRDILSTHQRMRLEYDVKEQDQMIHYHLNLCSTPEPEHKLIYQRLGIPDTPLPRVCIPAKSVVTKKKEKSPSNLDLSP